MRFGILGAAFLTALAFAGVAHAEPDPEVLLVPDFGRPERIEAAPDGRAWVVGGVGAPSAFVVGPGDSVERLPDRLNAPFPVTMPAANRLTLGKDGTIEQDGAAAPLPQAFLKQLGSKVFRKALTYDATRNWYVLLRSQRPLAAGTATDPRWSLVFFTPDHVIEEVLVPEVTHGSVHPLAAADDVVWVGTSSGVLRWQNGAWTEFVDQQQRRVDHERARDERNDLILGFTVFSVGNAAAASAFSTPLSLAGKQRFLPTATTSFVGSLPATATAGLLAAAGRGGNSGLGQALSGVAVVLGVLTIPVVALSTYATGELGFRGTNDGAYLGALGGAASGALIWTIAVAAGVEDQTLRKGWWWLLPIGGAFIGTASTTGYLWAGHGFSRY